MSRSARWALVLVGVLAFVLVPFFLVGERLESHTVAWMDEPRSAPWRVLLVASLLTSDVVLPIPSSVLQAWAGAALGFGWGVLACFLGSTGSVALGWSLGRSVGELGLDRLLSPDEQAEARAFLEGGRGSAALATSRWVPVLAEGVVLVAGATRTPFLHVARVTALANLSMALVYAGSGAALGTLVTPWAAWVPGVVVPGLVILVRRRLGGRG